MTTDQCQSPIDIDLSLATYDAALLKPVLSYNYPDLLNGRLRNTGNTWQLDPAEEQALTMTGGPVGNDTYRLYQLHCHWGSDSSKGAEHRLEGVMHAAEIHFVHYNSTKYASFNEAYTQPDGLCVTGIFLKPGAKNDAFAPISDQLGEITKPGKAVFLPTVPLMKLLTGADQYFTYPGSLTTPPYLETVRWLLIRQPVEVSEEQLEAMRQLKGSPASEDAAPACLSDNYRDLHPLNGRVIRTNFPLS